MQPLISIVIPCFNAGAYLAESIDSAVNESKNVDTEIIVVDDGSTDAATTALLNKLKLDNTCKIVFRENGGPAAARNTGVKTSHGNYIVFLDSDNRLRPGFIEHSLEVMKTNPQTGVVYGKAFFFGEMTSREPFETGPYDIDAVIEKNYIDMCSMVRRETWDAVQGFEEDRSIIGFEDWEFWIHISRTNWKFSFIPEILFDYRLRSDSVLAEAADEKNYNIAKQFIYRKHVALIAERFGYLFHQSRFYQSDKKHPLRSFLKYTKQNFSDKINTAANR